MVHWFPVRSGLANLPYFCVFTVSLFFSITSGLRGRNSHSPEHSAVSCRPPNGSARSSRGDCSPRSPRPNPFRFQPELVKVREGILIGRASSSLFFLRNNNLSIYLICCFLFINSPMSATVFNSFLLLR